MYRWVTRHGYSLKECLSVDEGGRISSSRPRGGELHIVIKRLCNIVDCYSWSVCPPSSSFWCFECIVVIQDDDYFFDDDDDDDDDDDVQMFCYSWLWFGLLINI